MSTDISMQTTDYQVGDRTWHLSRVGNDYTPNVTLDVSKFNAGATAEVQTITISGSPTSGSILVNGQTVARNASAADVQEELEEVFGAGKVTVSGSAGGPWAVHFDPSLGDVPTLVVDDDGLLGGSNPAAAVTTGTAGVNGHYANGYIPSGTVLGRVSATDLYGPYDPNAGDGRNTATGILFADCRVVRQDGSTAAKVGSSQLVRGDVRVSKLPFQAGSGAIDSDAKADLPLIRFVA
ncbi:head decoration protein [Mycolicibacter heraklionensis]|uniref:head decoration protein n=1 Tax=Mycolicibacter heraklionensis TaxID=512402 RepID=UPI00069976DD|nr:head decoration protein [Mycolicibacter heraklionensis]